MTNCVRVEALTGCRAESNQSLDCDRHINLRAVCFFGATNRNTLEAAKPKDVLVLNKNRLDNIGNTYAIAHACISRQEDLDINQ